MREKELSIQVMPEHASFFGRGLAREVDLACDAFWERRGVKKRTMAEVKKEIFADRLRRAAKRKAVKAAKKAAKKKVVAKKKPKKPKG
jgi:hypothetical protein